MTDYPKLGFRRVARHSTEKTRYAVFHRGGRLGEVYSLYTGGWSAVPETGHSRSGYATRYEAAYSLYTETHTHEGGT